MGLRFGLTVPLLKKMEKAMEESWAEVKEAGFLRRREDGHLKESILTIAQTKC